MTSVLEQKPLTGRMRADGQPVGLRDYRRAGGYEGLRRALQMSPKDVIEEVTKANVRGRGGAGFPAGRKWASVPDPARAPGPRYVVVNADEMEPGTFKDRFLMEGDPHQLIEGAAIAAYAIQAQTAYIFLRAEYTRPANRLQQALREAYDEGLLGRNILGSGFDLDMYLHMSGGRYICGESGALLNAMEGRRAIPRTTPPYGTAAGLWGRPTVVNNVETLCNIPHILRHGAAWYQDLSRAPTGPRGKDGGTKIFAASGRVRRPGAWELPLGVTLGELMHEHAGGMREGYRFRALLPGGASTEFLTEQHFDVSLDFDSVRAVGSRLATGTVVVADHTVCLIGMLHNLQRFFAQESCGWCTPCREGLPWIAKILAGLEAGEGRPEDVDLLKAHVRDLGPGRTFCALAPGAMESLGSALQLFPEDFERHISAGGCPLRSA